LAFVDALDVARGEFALAGDLNDGACQVLVGGAVDGDLDVLADTDPAELGFRHADLHPEVVGPE